MELLMALASYYQQLGDEFNAQKYRQKMNAVMQVQANVHP